MPIVRFIVTVHTEDPILFEDKSRLGDLLTDACVEVFPEGSVIVTSQPSDTQEEKAACAKNSKRN